LIRGALVLNINTCADAARFVRTVLRRDVASLLDSVNGQPPKLIRNEFNALPQDHELT